MDLQSQNKKIYQEVAKRLKIDVELVEDIDKYYFDRIRSLMSDTTFDDDLSEEEFKERYNSIVIHKLVTFRPDYKRYVNKKNRNHKAKED